MIKEVMTGVYFKGEDSFSFDFYTDLTMSNKLRFVNSVIDLIVNDGNYNYIIRDLIFDFYIIDIFTDISTIEFKESNSFIDDVENFLEETNIVDVVKANMEFGLLEELNKAIDLNIEYKTGIHANLLNEALSSLANTIESKVNEMDLNSMMGMATRLNNITDEFTTENIVKAYIEAGTNKDDVDKIN